MRRWRVPVAGIAAAVLLVAVYFVGLRSPRSAQIADLQAETDQLLAQRTELSREIKGLEEVASRETELKAALRVLEQFIPAQLAQPLLLAQLQRAADAAGVDLVSVTFGDPEVPKAAPPSHVPGTVLVAMAVIVVVEGPYRSITDHLRRVEVEMDRAVLVGSVALTEAEVGFPQLRGTWSGQAYALVAADDPLLSDQNAPPEAAASSTVPPQGRPAPSPRNP